MMEFVNFHKKIHIDEIARIFYKLRAIRQFLMNLILLLKLYYQYILFTDYNLIRLQ
jgi:hypothetical protein